MNKERVVIFILVGLMFFSAIATALYFVAQDKPDADVSNSSQAELAAQCQSPSADIASYEGRPVGDWPITSEPASELKVENLRSGDGAELKLGDCISVHYRLSLADGTPVTGNDTFQNGAPITFEFVEGGLIKGWTDGLVGLKEGGVRRLIVPPTLGYGEAAQGGIPANSTLIFDVELVKIES